MIVVDDIHGPHKSSHWLNLLRVIVSKGKRVLSIVVAAIRTARAAAIRSAADRAAAGRSSSRQEQQQSEQQQ